MAENEIMAETEDIETSPKIPRTLKVHKVLRTYHEDNICKMEFYKLADETDPFNIQWYCKEVDRKFVDTSVSSKLVLKSNQHLSRSFSLFCSKVFMFI